MRRMLALGAAALVTCGFSFTALASVVPDVIEPAPAVEPRKFAMPADALSLQFDNIRLSARRETELKTGARAHVIVVLRGSEVLAAPASDPAALKRRNTDIASLQDQVLARVFGQNAEAIAAADAAAGVAPRVKRAFDYIPAIAMRLNAADIERLAADPGVAWIEEDELSAPLLNESLALIGATTMHTAGHVGAGQAVAVLDSGVSNAHLMFAGKMPASTCHNTGDGVDTFTTCPNGLDEQISLIDGTAGETCLEDNDDATNGTNGCFHGTHVAGIAAGSPATFSFSGTPATLAGVARGANVIAQNVFTRFTSADDCEPRTAPCILSFNSDQIAALEWIAPNAATFNIAAANMSLGGGSNATHCDTNSRKLIIDFLRSLGVATVIATGNDGFTSTIGSPACISTAIAVGSTTKTDLISSFSNSAPPVGATPMVDFLAPGSSIRSAFPACPAGSVSGCTEGSSRAATASGTSMATPHVAGAFALLKGRSPSASVTDIENALRATGKPIRDPRNGVVVPRIQVDAASDLLVAGGVNAGVVAVAPIAPGFMTGFQEQPESFGTVEYTLTNTSGAPVNWTADDGGAAFAAIAPAGGSLAASASVVVTVSATPAGLVTGDVRNGTITFTNTTSGATTKRTFGLEVVPVPVPPPSNNDFADRLTIVGPVATVTGRNVDTDKEAGEPNHFSTGGASVWWTWTAPSTGSFVITTAGSDFDTLLGVYTGAAVDALTPIASNDDAIGLQSSVTIAATAGTVYQIAVDGFNGETGNITLAVSPEGAPGNDAFAGAIALDPSGAGEVVGHTTNATAETGEPAHAAQAAARSVWYSFAPTETGAFVIDTEGSPIDTRIAVYTGSAVDALAEVAANDDRAQGPASGQSSTSRVSFDGAAGTTYRIAVDTATAGGFTLGMRPGLPTTNIVAAVAPGARSVGVGVTATAFGTIVNGGSVTAENCGIEAPLDVQGAFSFQTTDPATNAPIGTPDTRVAIPAGEAQSFVFAITPSTPVTGQNIELRFTCDNAPAVTAISGLNTFVFSAANGTPADVVSIYATEAPNDGVVRVPVDSASFFTVAGINIGGEDSVTFTVDTGGLQQPLTVTMCETNTSGTCINPVAPSADPVVSTFGAGQTRFFSVFLTGQGTPISFDPANNRMFATFTTSTGTVGATSLAVRTTQED